MFVRFFSSVEGRAVARYGKGSLIGAERTAEGIVFDTSAVVGITAEEWARHGRTYERHLKLGDLEERTEDQFNAANPADPTHEGA